MNKNIKKHKGLLASLLLAFIVQGFAPILQFNTANATGVTMWTQTSWIGGDGQETLSDDIKFNSESGEGIYLQGENLRMKINADVVMGQEDFISGDANQGGSVAADTLNQPHYAYHYNGKLLLTDAGNNRILIYNTIPTVNNATPDVVIGQLDFTSGDANQGSSPSANTISRAHKLIVYEGKLIVTDSSNHRVLIYNTIPTSNNASADIVIGQADMTGGSANRGGSVGANTFRYVRDLAVVDGKLIFADPYNNRVLIYNTIPTSNGASADIVIGQADMISSSDNQGGSSAANTIRYPTSVYYDESEEKLLIADSNNHRILIYDQIPTENNASADIVIGQEDFTEGSANQGGSPASDTFAHPVSLDKFNGRYFIPEWINNRILIFDSLPTTNNASADHVLGQPNFTSNTANQGGSISANVFSNTLEAQPLGDEKLLVTDYSNHRALIFNKTRATSTLTSSTYETSEEQDFGPITWNAQTTNYSDIKMEVSTDEGLTFQEVQNNQEFIGRGTSITYKVTLISKDGLSTPTFQDISIQHRDPSNEDIDNVELKLNNKKTELQKNKRILIEKKKTKISGQNTKLVNGEIKIYRNKKQIAKEDVDENGNWNTNLKFKKSKKYTLTFKFYDQHGTKLDSQKYKVKIDLEDPTFTDFPANNIYKKRGAKLYWSATDNDKVKKFKATLNGKITKTKDSHIIIPQDTPTGTHTFTVKVYDKAGNTAKQSINVRVY